MKHKLILAVLSGLLMVGFSTDPVFSPWGHSTCTGSDPCNACKNCRYCAHCAKEGGTCGVCKRR